MTDVVKWGIIGAGDVTETKSGPAFYKTEHSSLIAIMRRNEAKAEDYARRHNVSKYYTNADELINDPEINAIYVATPPSSHKEYALKALQAGKPVYVEKPMAMNYPECKEMIEAAKKADQKLFVAYYRRGLPYFLKVKELLEEQSIGDILNVSVKLFKTPQPSDHQKDTHTWRIDKAIAGEGYFYDLAPHTLDILDFLLGEIEEAKGFSTNRGNLYEVKDTLACILKFKSGAIGVGEWCFVTSKNSARDSVIITGTKGEIRFSTFAFTPIQLQTNTISETFDIASPEHIQQPLIQIIVDELRGIGKCPSTGDSGARTSMIMDMILGNDLDFLNYT
ncbi:Gfo/Idh/MocA family protein [Dysgonomonas sp. 520]|uniref:Gfo/Idh/MocA family protein n=1 Tax=Dysgonomonas sp. 520 TaxID=2302931 RepID=UPI0013D5109E|nr:Gfo/Idh/MocA family oxidoreductase [Dysgonomonas sp. 520]NDW09900.1 gfo/Idh/MocA family oxidoreductase [Dysgonomonas sp. 520]